MARCDLTNIPLGCSLRDMTATEIPKGTLIEWDADFASTRTGIVANLPQVRNVGVVFGPSRRKPGFLQVIDCDGNRCFVNPAEATVIAPQAEAGWGNLA